MTLERTHFLMPSADDLKVEKEAQQSHRCNVHVSFQLWTADQHEPMVVALIFLLLLSRPRQVQDTELMVEL